MRSCYESSWFLFRDAPAAVRGRYYFSPPGTPFLPGSHFLGSRNWAPNEVQKAPQGLGESWAGRQQWYDGAPPLARPAAVSVGGAPCFATGARFADAIPVADTVDGFPLPCFTAPPPNPDLTFGADVGACETQRYWAGAVALVYLGDAQDLADYIAPRFRGATVYYYAVSTLWPAFALIVHPDYVFCVLAGTSTLAQVLIEALDGAGPPQNYGDFATGALWFQFASVVLNALKDAGVTDGRPIGFIGHSYGGASGMIGAARVQLGQEGRAVCWLTFGAPKPGDARLAKILGGMRGLAIANDGDLITALPPDLATLLPMVRFLPMPFPVAWLAWEYPPNYALQVPGALLLNELQQLDTQAVLGVILAIIADGAVPAIAAHRIGAYQAAIAQRCPGHTVLLPPVEVLAVLAELRKGNQWGEVIGVVPRYVIRQAVYPGQVLGGNGAAATIGRPGQVLGAFASFVSVQRDHPAEVLGALVTAAAAARPGQVLGCSSAAATIGRPGQVLGCSSAAATIGRPGQVLGCSAIAQTATGATIAIGEVLGATLAALAQVKPGQVLGASSAALRPAQPGQVLGCQVLEHHAVPITRPGAEVLGCKLARFAIGRPGQVLGASSAAARGARAGQVLGCSVNAVAGKSFTAKPGEVLAVTGVVQLAVPSFALLDRVGTGSINPPNGTTDNIVYSCTIPGGTLKTLGMIRFHVYGQFHSPTTAGALTISIKLGLTTMWSDTTTAVGGQAIDLPWSVNGLIVNDAAPGSQSLGGFVSLGRAIAALSGGGDMSQIGLLANPLYGGASEDETGDLQLQVTIRSAIVSNVTIIRYAGVTEYMP